MKKYKQVKKHTLDQWNTLKKKVSTRDHKPPFVSEREIWWVSIGENVGSEVNGKSDLFSRPAIVFKKLSHSFYYVIPTTTQDKAGSWFVPFRHKERNMVACLHQARAVDHRRLSSKLGQLDTDDFIRIVQSFKALYVEEVSKKYSPSGEDGAAANAECTVSVLEDQDVSSEKLKRKAPLGTKP